MSEPTVNAGLIEWNSDLAEWEREHGSVENAEMHEATAAALEQADAAIEAALKVTDDMRSSGWHLGKTVSEMGQKIYEILSGTTANKGAEDE